MGSVLIDNWSLDSFYSIATGNYSPRRTPYPHPWKTTSPYEQACWQNVLMAIVLWDDIKFLPMESNASSEARTNSSFWDRYDSIDILDDDEDIFQGLDVHEKLLYLTGNLISPLVNESIAAIPYVNHDINQYACMWTDKVGQVNHLKSMSDEAYALLRYEGRSEYRQVRGDLLERTFIYLARSGTFGLNYLPHPFRASYIAEVSLIDMIFDRSDLLRALDKEVKAYYDHLNELLAKRAFKCAYPVLYDYIRRNTDSYPSEIRAAIALRKEKDVVKFGKQLDELDQKVNNGNVEAVLTSLQQINELVEHITGNYKKDVEMGELSIGLSPALNLPLRFSKRKKEISLTFLTKLVDFSLHERVKR